MKFLNNKNCSFSNILGERQKRFAKNILKTDLRFVVKIFFNDLRHQCFSSISAKNFITYFFRKPFSAYYRRLSNIYQTLKSVDHVC